MMNHQSTVVTPVEYSTDESYEAKGLDGTGVGTEIKNPTTLFNRLRAFRQANIEKMIRK